MKITNAVLFALVVLFIPFDEVLSQDYPIIGIVSQEITDSVITNAFPKASTYIYATYIKAVESAGARVIPIMAGGGESYYRKILSSVNGIVLPGGDSPIAPKNPYYDTAKFIYDAAIKFNDAGVKFPILGVCLGFEYLAILGAGGDNMLKNCSVIHENCPLHFTVPLSQTRLFSKLTIEESHTLQLTNATANIHTWCVLPDDFNKRTPLKSNWKITATSRSAKKQEFVASLEHVTYPIFGVQFHPEVIPFEWSDPTMYPRTEDAVKVNQYFYNTLVHYSRQNNQSFKAGEEEKLLIYNYPVVYAHFSTPDGPKRQIYLF